MQNQAQQLIKKSTDPKLIGDVFEFAKQIYTDKKWLQGKDLYIDHVLRMAINLQDMEIDKITIATSLLYGVADTSLPGEKKHIINEVEKKFGKEIAGLVKKTSELNKIYYSFRINNKDHLNEAKNENLRKMFFAIAKDVRVIIIKIASRIDSLNRLDYLSQETKKLYAIETLEIFVPIANRLGLGEVKRKLEDLSFAYLYPEKFSWLQENIKEKYEERQKYLKKFIPHLKKILKHERIKFIDINYRAKSYWSTYQKLQRHDMNFEKIYDLVALRLVVSDVATCYKTLGVIHKYFQPMSGQIQDYIAKPKDNGYKSLHTTVFLQKTLPMQKIEKISEIQIKTAEMHKEAQFGICAHWAYKEKIDLLKDQEKLKFSEKIPEFIKTFNIDFFENQIFVFTPKGDVITLPKESTPIDFAYAVHSDVGDHCESAKIDGKIIPLSHKLNSGDVIEIITSLKKKPSQDWLKFVKTGFARSHIKKIITATFNPIFSVPAFIKKKIFKTGKEKKEEKHQVKKIKASEIYIGGQKGIAVNFAKCCLPKSKDATMAYLAKHRVAVLHKTSCKNFQKIAQKFPERIIDASWK
ncbi:MAG: hypothetical protein A3C58_01875 [Candidatus Staskawiczbacteria bacterium RIFCSPHIGHO2_02_FULL_34_10]|uniref:TGS domain-containing protein n=2 Tax=Candidatus Staskawicziibacteriota TaxID=1817916 RepID=A0A1G2HLS7_9BACT|nr:MAG: hypothetical protein A2639_03170 [Candidatus Staskawiczbacteria bacterium RIFCSPHIGHO2_01_FULL_34_27]OGZ67720.1 MAG: hypothetical protein A3C58_01875 [Candidatus Staskawiczbacteria bacterium RIFCSPHIGHO2_02_FULL_34_10]